MTYRLLVALHLLGAAVWVGGHLVLSISVLPRALRARDPGIIREFESGFERLGIPALLVQVVTGLGPCAWRWQEDGTLTLTSKLVRNSLKSAVSKVWIGEYLIEPDGLRDIKLIVLGAAAPTPAKLQIPKWTRGDRCTGEGLMAPYPEFEYSWLDLKGGFVDSDGRTEQIKAPAARSLSLHACGWT